MELKQYEIKFTKRNTNAQRVVNGDAQLREISNNLNPLAETSKGETFVNQMDNLIDKLVTHDDGYFQLDELPALRRAYITKRGMYEGSRPNNLEHYARVFDAVTSNALYNRAKELTKAEAREYDCELADIQKETGLFLRPQQKEGDVFLPCNMEDIAFIDDEQAGTWSTDEPYANIF